MSDIVDLGGEVAMDMDGLGITLWLNESSGGSGDRMDEELSGSEHVSELPNKERLGSPVDVELELEDMLWG